MKLRLARRPDLDESPRDGELDEGLSTPVLRYLEELRRSIVRSCAGIGVGMVIAFVFIQPIFDFVFQPIRAVLPQGSRLIYTQPGEAFSVYVQIALIAGIVFAAPFVMYQMWRLVAPALYLHQKRLALPFILLTTTGFVGGALFNHYVVFRWVMAFFGSFSSFNLAFLPRLADVFGLYTKMLFALGLVFQMPALVYFLARMELVTARFLVNNLKYAIFLTFVIAAVITPTGDVTVQTLFALPMIGLYVVSIVVAWMVGRAARRAGRAPAAAATSEAEEQRLVGVGPHEQ